MNGNGRFKQGHIGLSVIVRAGAKVSTMGNGDSFAYGDFAQIVDEHMLPDRAPVSDGEIPRKVDDGGWVDVYIRSHFCAEATEGESAPSKARPGAQAN